MYVEYVKNRKSPGCLLLRESYRQDGKVKTRTLANLTRWPGHIVEGLRALLKGSTVVQKLEQSFDVVRSLPHGHAAAVLGVLRQIGLHSIISSKRSRKRDLIVAMIAARIIAPGSKLATARAINKTTASSTLGEQLGVGDADEDELYAAMDWLGKRQQIIEAKLAGTHLRDGSIILYDVSGSYYTGTHCKLAANGHNRDRKKGFPQIVYGLLCNVDGCPIAVEVFKGNTADPSTLSSQIEKLRQRFALKRVILVGDRGMLTSARINEELRGVPGLDWISALRGPAIRKLVQDKHVDLSLFDEQDLAEISSPDFPDERLVICRNPLLAEERARKRKELLEATERELDKIVTAVHRQKRPLKGTDKIALRIGKLINRYKVAKHFILDINETTFSYSRDEIKIAEEAALDGLYVIRTSVETEAMQPESAVSAYKNLAKVERAFRSFKTVDLKVRPIYHWLEPRVRAHVFLCMLAYYVEWHMRQRLAPILFDDDDKAAAEAARKSVVAPAQPSPKARRKANSKVTDDGGPVHSFQTLLADLATIVSNRMVPKIPDSPAFCKITMPSQSQQRALDLLKVRL